MSWRTRKVLALIARLNGKCKYNTFIVFAVTELVISFNFMTCREENKTRDINKILKAGSSHTHTGMVMWPRFTDRSHPFPFADIFEDWRTLKKSPQMFRQTRGRLQLLQQTRRVQKQPPRKYHRESFIHPVRARFLITAS